MEEPDSLVEVIMNRLILRHVLFPLTSFPPPYVTGRESESWMYNAVAKSWANWLPPETRDTILR